MTKYLQISSYIRKPFLIHDFATAPFWISLHMRKILFSFLSVYKRGEGGGVDRSHGLPGILRGGGRGRGGWSFYLHRGRKWRIYAVKESSSQEKLERSPEWHSVSPVPPSANRLRLFTQLTRPPIAAPPLLNLHIMCTKCYWKQLLKPNSWTDNFVDVSRQNLEHKVNIYIKSALVYVPSSELGLSISLQPHSRQRVCPSPRNQRGGGTHTPAGERSLFRRLGKSLTLWLLCDR